MSLFADRYRRLPAQTKALLTIVNRECGFGIAAELLQHLTRSLIDDVDDKFWEKVDPGEREKLISVAKANRFTKIGTFDLTQTT